MYQKQAYISIWESAARAVRPLLAFVFGGVCRVVFPRCWSFLALVVVGFVGVFGAALLFSVLFPRLAWGWCCVFAVVRRVPRFASRVVCSVSASVVLPVRAGRS